MVRMPRPDAKHGESSRIDPGRFPRVRRRGLVLAQRCDSPQSARRRPLSVAILGCRLSGRRVGQWHASSAVTKGRRRSSRSMQPPRSSRAQQNRIAVRVLSPFNQPIDGICSGANAARRLTWFNIGGIVDSVELVVAPQVRMDDLFVRADPKTGKIRIEAEVYNASKNAVRGSIGLLGGTGNQRGAHLRDRPRSGNSSRASTGCAPDAACQPAAVAAQ